MEQRDQIRDFLPSDDELLRREKIFLSLIDKYNYDEGSDTELVEVADASNDGSESSDSDSSFSEMSGSEAEADFDAGEMEKQLQPFINDRVNGWAEKGIDFQLKTVDRGLSVEEWLEANQEFTTTSKKYKKTVINENNKTTTITTTQTKTVTTRTSVNMRRNTTSSIQMRKIADGESSKNVPDIEMEPRTEQNYITNDWSSSKSFDIPRGRKRHSTPDRSNLKRKATSPIAKRLSPQKMKLSNRKESVPTTMHSNKSESGISTNEISNDVSNASDSGIGSDVVSKEISSELTDEIPNQVSNEVLSDDGSVGYDPENVLEKASESDRSRKEETSRSRTSAGSSKHRPPGIVVYSPSAGKRFGRRIDNDFMSVTKSDFKKGIDPKYHKYTDFKLVKKCVVPVKQRIVYMPPTATEISANNDDSETDDDLLTSYTTTGRFYRLNSK